MLDTRSQKLLWGPFRILTCYVEESDDAMNELAARDRYMLSSMQSGMTVREVYPDLPEEEVVKDEGDDNCLPLLLPVFC